MKYLLSAATASALMAGTAFAGNIEPTPMEPVIAPAPMAVYQGPNWTGFYAGGQLGYADVTGDGQFDRFHNSAQASSLGPDLIPFSANGDGMIGGITLGYDHDFGSWVAGVGADYDWTDIDLGDGVTYTPLRFPTGEAESYGTKIESIWRLKARAGAKLGNGLLYGTAGYAQADTNDFGSADGYFVGAGYEHLITENFSLGGEVLYHEFDNFKNVGLGVHDFDVEATTAQVRATFRF